MEDKVNKKNTVILFILISVGLLFYFVTNFQRIVIPGTIFDFLAQDLSVTAPAITLFGAIFMYVYAFGQLIMGVLVDRYGGYRIMITGGIILGIGCLLFPLSNSLPVMYFSRALIGLGGSSFYLSIIKELKNIFSDKDFGIAISVMLFIGYTGGILANAPFVFAMKYMAWREILIIVAAAVIVGCIVFILLFPFANKTKINRNIKIRFLPFRLVLHKRHNRNLFSFACCNFGISYVIQTVIGKKFLEDFCLYKSSKAAIILSIMAVVAAFANIINAYVCKMCHNHRVQFLKTASVITFLSLFAICFCIFFNIKTILIAVIFCILAGNASLSSLIVPVLHMTNHKMTSSTAVGIMNFCFFMMVGILGNITGFVLNMFKPEKIDNISVYSNNSYLLLFGIFFVISLFEMYKATRLSNKY